MDEFDVSLRLVGDIYALLHRKTQVTRREYDDLLSAAATLYAENESLRERLKELEQLASSWTGTPERNAPIVKAREALSHRFRIRVTSLEQP